MTETGLDWYTIDEVKAILAILSRADKVALQEIARLQARKVRGGDAQELLVEGITRVLERRRKWPRGLEVRPFMSQVLGSIVSAMAKRHTRSAAIETVVKVDSQGAVDCPQAPGELNTQPDVSDEVHASEMLSRIISTTAGDQYAQAVILAYAQGLTADEAQKHFGISQKDYDAARKRVRRLAMKLRYEEETT